MFSVRIVTTDHYMSAPLRGLDVQYADQRGSEVKKVPVVRIFGATPAGQKTCMHVHGVFPYLYVPYDGTAPWDRYLRQFASSLDKAINVAQGYGQSTIQHVYKIVLVSGTAMYGFHDKEQQFLKIYLYNPAMIRKAADLLLGGAVLNKAFQPHEAHIPYTLQLFIDYNLYGMNMINVGAVKFRRRDKDDNGNSVIVRDVSFRGSQDSDEGLGSDPRTPVSFTGLLNRSGSATPSRRTWDYENIPSELYLDPDVERLSTCELEVDVVAADILNRLEVNANVGANPGLAALWEDERQRCRDRGASSDIAPPGSPERVDIEIADSEVHLDNQLHEIVLQQMAYMDSQSESQEEESQEEEVPATPASAVELHFSQIEDESMSSQETVILDEEPDEKPIVNLESIHRVVSSSQSFCEVKPRSEEGEVEDKSLVDILASLAKDSDTQPVSQVAAETQVAALEEQDSILSQVSQPRDDDVERKEAEEVLEMSQRIWDEDMTLTSPEDKDSPVKPEVEEYDLAGLDETWQESQLEEKSAQESDKSGSEEDSDSDVIPQLDGPADEKPKEPKKRGPKRLGISGPVRYMPRAVPPMPQQMHQGYMNSQSYPGVPPNQQYGSNYYGNYGAIQNYRQWNPGMQQNSGIQHGSGMVHNPHMQQNPGVIQNPRMQNPGMHQGPGMMQNPPMQKNLSMQQSPAVQQSPLAQNSMGMPQSHGMKQNLGTLHSPGALQSPGFEQMTGMLQNHGPGTQHSPGTLQSPGIQHSPGLIQSQGTQQSPGSQQNSGMLQSPHMQRSPDNQLSQGIMQSHIGNFSPPSAASWDQEQTYSMQNSPPLVDVYGNEQKSQYSADLNSNQKSNQYQHNPASTFGYHSGQTTPSTYAGSVLRSEISSYNQRVYPSQRQQVSPGYQSSASHTQHSYQPSQMSPGYNKPQNLHAGVSIQQAYSAPQDFNQPSSETHQRNTSIARTVSQLSMTPKDNNISSSTPQITHWQQRASALASKSQQRFQSPQSVVGNPRCQVSTTSASLPPTSAAGNYVGYERTQKSVENYFSQASLVQNAMPVSHMVDENTSGNASDIVKPVGGGGARSCSLSQRYMAGANANISTSPVSSGSHGYSTVMKSPCSESDTVSQPVSNILGNVAFSKSTNSLANIDALSQRRNSQDWNVTSSKAFITENYNSCVNNEPKSSNSYARKQLLYPQQSISQSAQNVQNEAQNSYEWKNLSSTQSNITSAVPYVQGHQRTLSNSEMKMNQTKVPEATKANPKALKPPAEGPISRYYRLKRENGAVTSAASEDVKSPESEKQTSQHSTPLSSPVNTSDRHDSALHKLLLEQQAVNPVVVPDVVKPLDIGESSTENMPAVSDGKKSSLTSLLLEEDSKEAIVWQSSGLEDQLFSHKNVPPNKHSSPNSTGVNLSANLNDSQEDLFADASQKLSKVHMSVNDNISLTGDSSFVNENTDDDSSVSVFSDGLDSKDMGQFQIGANQVAGSEAVVEAHKRSFHSKSLDLQKHSDLSSLSDLKHFVGSVQKESEYGASFQKSDIPVVGNAECSQPVSNMNVNEGLAAGSFQQGFVKSPEIVNTLQQRQPNLMQSPDMLLPKPKRKYTRKNPNLPPIKRSVSVPAIPGLKRKRGRPRKESFTVQVPSSVQNLIKSDNYHENFQPQQFDLSFQNQQFQQQTYNQQNYTEPVFYPEPSYQNQVPYQEPSFFPQEDMPNQSSFLKELMAENDSFEFQQQNSCSDSFSSESTEKAPLVEQSENNSEKAATESQNETVEKVKNAHDASYNYTEMHRRANQEMQAFHKQQEMLSKSVFKSQPIWRSAAQKEKIQADRKSESSCNALTQDNVVATTCSSPAYTFQFKVPTPVYKRLKLRFSSGIRETVNKFEIVRMLPKDARKYSLMKIGSEIVKLHKLSRNEIDRIQEDLLSGKEVLGLPPALRQVEIASSDNSALQNELSETLLNSLQENQEHLAQLYQDENNIHIQRKQRKNSDSLFKNRNIANIPHLKKYRAGFPYFGKGNVGKKVPSKQAHPVLSPELEEDNEVVIKDVSLTDASEGTLTPIKSRTPITGRSPAHSGGHILETENKEYLDNKLKDFEGELELTSQANEQQMFVNESDLFDDQKQVDEYEGSTDSDGNDAQVEVEEESSDKSDLLEKSAVAIVTKADKTNVSEILQQPEMAVESENNEAMSENELERFSLDKIPGNKLCNKGNELSSKDSMEGKDSKVIIEESKEPGIEQELVDKVKEENTNDVVLESKDCLIGSISEISDTAVNESEVKSRSRSNSYESFSSSKCSSRRESSSNSNDFGRPKRQSSIESYVAQMLEKSKGKRKRSSSNSSQNINTCKSSFEDQENNHKRRKKHSKKKRKKKHRNHNDSDSDGIPGVDYIVVGRFKGHKEMRVVLHKIDADKLDSLSAEEMILTQSEKEKGIPKRQKLNSGDKDGISCPSNTSVPNATIQSNAFTGFSAEFEKFLAQTRGGNSSNNKTHKSRKPFTQMPRQHTNTFGSPESKPNSEDSSSKGESATRSSTTENSDGSANEHGESSSSDMCLSTNHSVSYQNVPTFSSAGELNIFLGELADKNNKTACENGLKQQRLHLSIKRKHSHKRKKRNTIHDRMSRAFVGRKRKKHSSRKPTKLMNSLSVLHNATMEKLTEDNKLGPIKLKINLKSLRRYPDYELYSDDVDSDYDAPYCDTMYKLAWYSPPESETGDLSPPQPLSPEQMTDQHFSNLENPQKTVYHTPLSNKYATTPTKNEIKCFREDRLSLLDVKKTVNSANSPLMGEKQELKEQRLTLADIQKTIKNAKSSDAESKKDFKEERVTLTDIQKTMPSANSSEMEGEKGLKEEKLTISHIKKVMKQANTAVERSEKELDTVSVSHLKTIVSDLNPSTDDHISNNIQLASRNHEHNENIMEISKQVKLVDKSQPFEDIEMSPIKTTDMHAYGNHCFENVVKQGLDLSEKLESRIKENHFGRVPLADLPPLTVADDLHKLPTDDERESVHSNKSNEENISPPDLGPPNIPRFSPRQYLDGNCRSDPPLLTISKESLYVDVDSEFCQSAAKSTDVSECRQINEMDHNSILNTPPNLIPCKSPGSQSFSSASPRHQHLVSVKDSELKQGSEHLKKRPGRSPAACSSSGSINVIHSEEFSDISDEDSDDEIICSQNNQVYDKNYGMPALSITRHNIMNYLQNSAKNAHQGNLGKDTKIKEIAEFEKHMHEKDGLENAKATEENQINRDLLKDSVREFERKHQYEAVNLSKSSTRSNENIGSPEFKRKNSVPLYNSNYSAASYNEPSYSERSRTLSQGPYQNNMTVNYNKPGLESCKFTRMRQERFNISATKPKFMSLDCVPQNGFRNPVLKTGSYESRNSFCTSDFEMAHVQKTSERPLDMYKSCEGSTSCSPPRMHQNLFHSHISNNSDSNRNNSSYVERNNRNLFSDCTKNMLSAPNVLSNVELSESNRTSYSICRNRRISDSIIRSVTNHTSVTKEHLLTSEQLNTQYHNHKGNESHVPFNQFGTGGNKNVKHKKMKQSGEENESESNLSEQDVSGHSSERGGGDTGPNGNKRGTDKHGSLEMLAGCQVITPLTAPPTRECVYESANQFGLPSVQSKEAFYGNPKDAPEQPREGGGQLLKVASNMVKTLNEFETNGKSKGLVNWRNSFCAKENLFSSQRDESLSDKLVIEPALKYALTGDRKIIVTPCLLPPSKSKVKEWLKGRKLYKALKKKLSVIPAICAEDKVAKSENKDESSKVRDSDLAAADQSKPGEACLNLFTGKREVIHEASDLPDKDVPPVLEREEPYNGEEFNEESDSRHRGDDSELEISPPYKQKKLDDSSQLHSTPLTRRSSSDLFESGCTPIGGDGRVTPTIDIDDKKEEEPSGFVTPKRIRPPLRRLSTNTESTLRRAIITTQMKQQFCTPALQKEVSQIEGPTPKNSFGFKVSQQNFQDAKALHENQYLTVVSIELHVETRGDLRPDPEFDSIQGLFYSIFNDVPPEKGTRHETGAIIVDAESANQNQASASAASKVSGDPVPGTSKSHDLVPGTSKSSDTTYSPSKSGLKDKMTVLQKSGVAGLEVTYVKNETVLLQTFIDFIKKWDPDILVGYEIQQLSWGYLLQRASTVNTNLAVAISRVPTSKTSSHMSAAKDEYGADHNSEIHIAGRIVLNLWRLMRHEVTLNVYTFENVAFHVLHRRVPVFSFRNLTSWYKHKTHLHRWKVINYYVTRVKGNLEMMEQLDLIGRTSEFARVFGIEFYHVLSRGSQYRVESMMLRVAKPMNYIPVSPNVHQRARMKAPECIPLTLEPQSRFYTDPVVVLDFQSLYPSIMIAYNYCFSTCMGRVDWLSKAHDGPVEFGCTSLNMPPSVLKKHQDKITYSPNGVAFVKQSVKRGVLPVMVEEILNTRLMVKKAMKSYKGDKTLSRMLDARQLGLKLIANVTYGYTGANFSGRMPCIEVGDSIVRKARETLERSIKLVEETPKWGAKVIYGDTDSMFLLLKGKSKDEAFKIGQEIADTVTKMFPKPVKLKFEKVYLPCVLQTKKRYVGFMYETPDQKDPVYDAKGIETVRRDSCQAVSKVLERSIKILFQTRDVSQVKSYVQHQCQKLMEGTVSLQDCIFAKEFRGMSGYKPGACVPALEIAKKLIRQDRRAEPRVGERVPYVIVYGSPGLPLIQLVKQPMELLQDGSLRLNSTYYITKQILPPLSRFLSLLGVDVFSWYQEMPHSGARAMAQAALPQDSKKGTISQYFATSNCPICDQQTKQPICHKCMREPQMVSVTLSDKITRWERLQDHLNKVCSICIGCTDSTTVKSCMSLDCPILYRQSRAQRDVSRADNIREILNKVFS